MPASDCCALPLSFAKAESYQCGTRMSRPVSPGGPARHSSAGRRDRKTYCGNGPRRRHGRLAARPRHRPSAGKRQFSTAFPRY